VIFHFCFYIVLIYKQMSKPESKSEWRAPCYKGRRNACRRKQAAAEAERLSRSSSSSDDDIPKREKSKETIRHTVNPYSDVSTTGQSWSERIFGKGFKTKARRSKGSKKRRGRGKKTARRSRRH
jgi:hypothetical protein